MVTDGSPGVWLLKSDDGSPGVWLLVVALECGYLDKVMMVPQECGHWDKMKLWFCVQIMAEETSPISDDVFKRAL